MKDRYGRKIEYMRVSITDRCNLRCKYCMPDGCDKVSHNDILSYEDMERICTAASRIGITKFKVTGGEPLVRVGCPDFVKRLKDIPGTEQVTLTTNGVELERYMDDLVAAGLDAVNISLDTMDPDRFRYITGGGSLERTMSGIDAAVKSGIRTKINCLIQKDFNEDETDRFAELAFGKGIDVRFIEMMPIGAGNPDLGVANRQILMKLRTRWPELEPDESVHGNGPAVYFRHPEKSGSIGFISAMHGVFCSSCNRIRLTAQGLIKPCLCYEDSVDLKPVLSGTIEEIQEKLTEAVLMKPGQHCFNNAPKRSERRMMSQIGG